MRRLVDFLCVCAAVMMSLPHPSAATSTPFTGTPAAIPGTVRASDFDNGGEGIAYHDTSAGNKGGVYRQSDVDLEANVAGGYDLGWTKAGEWLNYTVSVATSGTYTATFRVASLGQGGTFHVEFNGSNVTGTVAIPDTGGWQVWQNVTKTVTLAAGVQVARVVMDSAGGSGNIGNLVSMTFGATAPSSTPYTGTAVSLPGTVQAENFDNGGEGIAYHDTTSGNVLGAYRSTDVDIEPVASGGFNVGKVKPGEWLKYSVNVTTTGSYRINVRVASLGQGGTFHLEMNGADVTGSLTIPDTGGWQNWQTISQTASLTAGPQIARLVMDAAATSVGNFDWIEFAAGTTPTPPPTGGIINVPAGGDLQTAIDAALPGDTIVLTAGAVYSGSFILRNKSGSSTITIRSSAAASTLPADGVRVTPANAGQLAKVQGGVAGMAAFITEPGAHHYRLQFLEIVSTYAENQIIEIGGFGTLQDTLDEVPHDIIIDRCYIHGNAVNGQKRGILLNAAASSVINSYISDIKSAVSDSQAIGVSNGPGPLTITNNYLEASGENIMIGGSDPSIQNLVPSDITIAGNTIRKQPSWRGQGWTVKNLIELKNAQRVVIDNNLMEYCWAAAQQGYAFMITPVNQDGGAPWTVVQHLQFTNNVVRHVASVADVQGIEPNTSIVTNDVVFRNNLFLDVSAANWGGAGVLLTSTGASGVVFDHNTLFTDGTSVIFADNPPADAFVFTNNIVPDNAWAIMGSNASPGNGTLAMYFPGAIVKANVFIKGSAGGYPVSNYFPPTVNDVGFVNLAGGDYRLLASSPYAKAATDGGAIGYSGPIIQ
jgi:carbohydrate binding protein with CBM6 domain